MLTYLTAVLDFLVEHTIDDVATLFSRLFGTPHDYFAVGLLYGGVLAWFWFRRELRATAKAITEPKICQISNCSGETIEIPAHVRFIRNKPSCVLCPYNTKGKKCDITHKKCIMFEKF